MSKIVSTRVGQLDGLRGVAVGLVVLFHYGSAVQGSRLLLPIVSRGWVGVDLFFVMSGFLIGGIVVANRDAVNFYSVFYLRRFLRIFPLYYFLLAVVAISVWLGWMPHPGHDKLVLYVVYLQNIAVALTHDYGLTWLQVTWSLAVEEHFYLMLPILVVLIPPRFLSHVLVAGVLVAILCRIMGYAVPVHYPRDFARFFTICRIDDLFYGVLLAVAVRNEKLAALIQSRRYVFYLSAGFFATGFLVASHFDYRFQNELLLSTVGLSLLGPLFLCVVVLAVLHEGSLVSLVMANRLLGWVGKRTYAIYLLHVPAINCLGAAFRHYGFLHFGIVLAISALTLTLCAATLSWWLIEAPLIELGHKHKYGRGAKPPVLSPVAAK
jgi:peptidoglycan/LPS O-acetylase OafA/YrhL